MRLSPPVISLLAVLGLSGTLPPAGAGQDRVQPPSLSVEQWRQDLHYFARELERRHKNLFHTVSREEFATAVARLDSVIPSLQAHQIVVRMKQIAAQVGDGHTGVHLPPYFTLYPISLYWFGTELRVIAATKEYQRALGARVVGIAELGIEEVQARVATCFPSATHENPWFVLSTSPAFITRPEVLHALGIVPGLGPAPFHFEDDRGTRFTLAISPVATPPVVNRAITITGLIPAAKSQPLFRQRPGEPFWFTYLPDSQTVYVSFRDYRGLGANARALFAALDRHPATRIVIDLRQNGGGDFFEGRKHLVEPLKQRGALNRKGG